MFELKQRMTDEQLTEKLSLHCTGGTALGVGFVEVITPFVVYKKVVSFTGHKDMVAELLIPAGALVYAEILLQRKSPGYRDVLTRKMRASQAIVQELYRYTDPEGARGLYAGVNKQSAFGYRPQFWREAARGVSDYDPSFLYTPGSFLVTEFLCHPEVCGAGVHFFIDYMDALAY